MEKIKIDNLEIYADFTDNLLSYFLFQFNCGVLTDRKNKEGSVHLLEHMLFKGTKNYSKYDLKENIEQYGGMINGMTSFEELMILNECLNEKTGTTLNIIGDIFKNSIFKKSEFDKEKNVVLEELKMMQDNPDFIITNYCTKNTLGITAEPGGNLKSVNNIKLEDIKNDYLKYINKNNLKIFYSGGLKRDELVKLITVNFSEMKRGRKVRLPIKKYIGKNKTFKDNFLSNTAYNLIIGYTGKINTDPRDKIKLEVLEHILSSGLSSVLFNELRDKRDLCYHASFSPFFLNKNSILSISVELNPKKTDKVRKVIDNIIHNLPKYINKKRLDKVKSIIKVSHLRKDTVGIARLFWLKILNNLNLNSTVEYFDILNKISIKSLIDFSDYLFNGLPKCEIIINGQKKPS